MASIIEVSGLLKQFGDIIAVDRVSFSVSEGSVFALLGPNGAGKTTTIKILTTLLRPTAGNILVNGFDPTRDQEAVRRSFGIVFQEPSVDDILTARENMELHGVIYGIPKNTRQQRIEKLLQFVGLWDRKDDLVKRFSGGMKRRLEIARGFLHHPKIFFLDEPTLGLDLQTRKRIWAYITQLNREEHMTVFFTTHYIEEAERVADTIVIMHKGRIVGIGSKDELKRFTNTLSIEDAFLILTECATREEDAGALERMCAARQWQG